VTHDPAKNGSEDAARLLRQAEELERSLSVDRERSSEGDLSGGRVAQSIVSIARDVSVFRTVLGNVKEAVVGFYTKVLLPVWRVVSPPIVVIFGWYAWIWRRYACVTKAETGERSVSRGRAALLISLTIAAVSAFTSTWLGEAVRFVTIEPILDASLMAASTRTETFYLSSSEEIDPDNNVHSVRGCTTSGQCAEGDAAYFRVRPRLMHDIWKLFRYGNPIYVPDHIVAPIAPGLNRCEVTYYGYRMTSSWTSRLLRSCELYPTMLEASCVHLGVPRPS